MKLYLSVALLLAASAPALAHVIVTDPEGRPGATRRADFRVSHACGASPTTAVRIEVPASVASAKAMPKAGWSLSTETQPLARPQRSESGAEVTTRVSAVTWRGRLDAAAFDEFSLLVRLPDQQGPVYFPTVQSCESGENRWVEIPAAGAAWNSVPHPAPVIRVAAATGAPEMADHDHEAMMRAMAAPSAVQAPSGTRAPARSAARPATRGVRILEAWSRATPPGAPTGAGFLSVANDGAAPDRLVGATSPASRVVELHTMSMDGGIMRMRPVPQGFAIPAGGQLTLAPGGNHLMLIGLAKSLKAGDRVPVRLRFERAGVVDTVLVVRPLGASR